MENFAYICIAGEKYIIYKKVLNRVPIVFKTDRIAKKFILSYEKFCLYLYCGNIV